MWFYADSGLYIFAKILEHKIKDGLLAPSLVRKEDNLKVLSILFRKRFRSRDKMVEFLTSLKEFNEEEVVDLTNFAKPKI